MNIFFKFYFKLNQLIYTFFLIIVPNFIIAQSDFSDKNVTIELLVVEYEHGDQFEWSFDVTSGTKGKFNEINYSPGSQHTINFGYNFLEQLDPNFKLNLKALVTNNYAQIVTNPHISVKNKAEAILDAQEEQYIVLQAASIYGVSNTLTTIGAGIKMIVSPEIINDSIVDLKIDGVISEFIPTSAESERVIETNSINTNVRIKNGYTLIIGGLIKKEELNIKSKVPFFGSIPLLGLLFRRTYKKKLIKEIVIYLTPHIHDSSTTPIKKGQKMGEDFLKKSKEKFENEDILLKPKSNKFNISN